jgi:hypothetical protein
MSSKNKKLIFGLLVLIIASALLLPKVARAGFDDAIAQALTWVLLGLVDLVGKLVIIVTRLLVSVAQYNDFINSPAVAIGWIVIRDICNMFFVLALLLIAFCSVLGIEQYSWKRALGGLILAIILVNFSKLIVAFFIDIAQVVMLTFVNAFKDAGEGNFAEMFGLRQLLDYGQIGTAKEVTSSWDLFWSAGLALILTIVALVVVTIITIILVFRIVILWFLMLFSPLPFLLGLFPQTSRFAQDFWNRFTNQVIVGPILAFCLWLSLAVVQQSVSQPNGNLSLSLGNEVAQSAGQITEGVAPTAKSGGGNILASTVTKIGASNNILSFVIGIVLLIGSLSIAQQLGVAGGAMAGRWAGKMQAWGMGAAKWGGKLPVRAVKGVWEGTGARATVRVGWEKFTTETGIGRWLKRQYSQEEKKKAEKEREVRARERLGLISGPAAIMEIQKIKSASISKRLEERGIFENRAAFLAHWDRLKQTGRANTDEGIEMARRGAAEGWLRMWEINKYALNDVKTDREKALSEWIRSQHADPLTRKNKMYEWDEKLKTYKTLSSQERENIQVKALSVLRPHELVSAFIDVAKDVSLRYDPISGKNEPVDREAVYKLKALSKSQFYRLDPNLRNTVLDALLLASINRDELNLTPDEAQKLENKYLEFGGSEIDARKNLLRQRQTERLLEEAKAARLAKGTIEVPPAGTPVENEKAWRKIGSRVDLEQVDKLIEEIRTALKENRLDDAFQKYQDLRIKHYLPVATDELTGIFDPQRGRELTEKEFVGIFTVQDMDFRVKKTKDPAGAKKILEVAIDQMRSPEKITLDIKREILDKVKPENVSELNQIAEKLDELSKTTGKDRSYFQKNLAILERAFGNISKKINDQALAYGYELSEELIQSIKNAETKIKEAKKEIRRENIEDASLALKKIAEELEKYNI